MAKQDDWVRLTVRLPPALYEGLVQEVLNSPNSMNAEIVERLEASFRTGGSRDAGRAAYEAAIVSAETVLARVMGVDKDNLAAYIYPTLRPDISAGIDRYISSDHGKLYLGDTAPMDAIAFILRDWLAGHGYLERQEGPEGAN